jgi:hypothetical protein
VNREATAKVIGSGQAELDAIKELSKLIDFHPDYTSIAMFFCKEVTNRAMRIRDLVEYEYVWGSKNEYPHGARAAAVPVYVWGKHFNSQIDEAAKTLAPTL